MKYIKAMFAIVNSLLFSFKKMVGSCQEYGKLLLNKIIKKKKIIIAMHLFKNVWRRWFLEILS